MIDAKNKRQKDNNSPTTRPRGLSLGPRSEGSPAVGPLTWKKKGRKKGRKKEKKKKKDKKKEREKERKRERKRERMTERQKTKDKKKKHRKKKMKQWESKDSQGQIHGYPSHMWVGRGHIWGQWSLWAGVARPKKNIHAKKEKCDGQTDRWINGPMNRWTDGPTKWSTWLKRAPLLQIKYWCIKEIHLYFFPNL